MTPTKLLVILLVLLGLLVVALLFQPKTVENSTVQTSTQTISVKSISFEISLSQQLPESLEITSRQCIVIDSDHQQYADMELEPIDTGVKEAKPKVNSNLQSTWSGIPEYQLNLTLA